MPAGLLCVASCRRRRSTRRRCSWTWRTRLGSARPPPRTPRRRRWLRRRRSCARSRTRISSSSTQSAPSPSGTCARRSPRPKTLGGAARTRRKTPRIFRTIRTRRTSAWRRPSTRTAFPRRRSWTWTTRRITLGRRRRRRSPLLIRRTRKTTGSTSRTRTGSSISLVGRCDCTKTIPATTRAAARTRTDPNRTIPNRKRFRRTGSTCPPLDPSVGRRRRTATVRPRAMRVLASPTTFGASARLRRVQKPPPRRRPMTKKNRRDVRSRTITKRASRASPPSPTGYRRRRGSRRERRSRASGAARERSFPSTNPRPR
mmetsp:Transcript_13037/g.55565  ORF Transcript_13037/g.55565 Transcript_13037/m.55565 type:complete len:315 (+) Transcript_13037:376-1320(+)